MSDLNLDKLYEQQAWLEKSLTEQKKLLNPEELKKRKLDPQNKQIQSAITNAIHSLQTQLNEVQQKIASVELKGKKVSAQTISKLTKKPTILTPSGNERLRMRVAEILAKHFPESPKTLTSKPTPTLQTQTTPSKEQLRYGHTEEDRGVLYLDVSDDNDKVYPFKLANKDELETVRSLIEKGIDKKLLHTLYEMSGESVSADIFKILQNAQVSQVSDRGSAEKALKNPGDSLIRYSKNANDYVLSYKTAEGECEHLNLLNENNIQTIITDFQSLKKN